MPQLGYVQTVLGPVLPDGLGITLPHEHLLSDLVGPCRSAADMGRQHESAARQARAHEAGLAPATAAETPASMLALWDKEPPFGPYSDAARNWVYYKSMVQLTDIDAAIEEVQRFKTEGGGCIVDQTSIGMARDPVGLQRISRATGVHVIMVTGYYVQNTHPPDLAALDEAGIYERIMREITEGVAWSVFPGMIGEIGLSWPVRPTERAVLRAAARACVDSGLPLSVHPGINPAAPMEAIRIIAEAGGDVSRTILCHSDFRIHRLEGALEVARTGCYVELDTFGREATAIWQKGSVDWPNDAVRLNWIAALVEQGHAKQVLISHDHAGKLLLHKWGGVGYDHINTTVVPLMRHKGFSRELIEQIIVQNPAEMLTVRK